MSLTIPRHIRECQICSRPTFGVGLSDRCFTCGEIPQVCGQCALVYILRGRRGEIKCLECFISGLYILAKRFSITKSFDLKKFGPLQGLVSPSQEWHWEDRVKSRLFRPMGIILYSTFGQKLGGEDLDRYSVSNPQFCVWTSDGDNTRLFQPTHPNIIRPLRTDGSDYAHQEDEKMTWEEYLEQCKEKESRSRLT